ncbi:MAG: thiamine phosphate synthase [Pseudomonadota bacterium]
MSGLNHTFSHRRKLTYAARQAERVLPLPLPGLFFLTDPDRSPDPCAIAERLPRGTGVVFRHYGACNRLDVATTLSRIARRRGLIFLIAADPVLAQKVKAHGVHWPEAHRISAKAWRRVFAIQTVSAHSPAALRAADRLTVDAAFVSTVFASNSASAGNALGPVKLRQLARSVDLPVYALGGINAQTASRVAMAAGLASIDGVQDSFGR